MYLLNLGLNVWNVLLLTASLVLGFTGSRWHVLVALFAAVVSALVHGGSVALLLGGSKLVKEHLGRFNLPLSILDRLNEVYKAFVPKAILGAATMPVVGVIGGLVGTGVLPRSVHWGLGLAAYAYNLWLVPHEYCWLKRFHGIVLEVSRRLPPEEAMESTAPHPDYTPDQVVLDLRGKAKALLFVGLTIPLAYLGYRFISGFAIGWLALPALVVTCACLGGSLHCYLRSRRLPPADLQAGAGAAPLPTGSPR
jgi:hypothetical protein